MKTVIRLLMIFTVIPFFFLTPLEALFFGVRWAFTGKSFPASPMYLRMWDMYNDKYL